MNGENKLPPEFDSQGQGRSDRCPGCGAPLQIHDPAAPGYVPPEVWDRGENVICQRCYRIRNYGEQASTAVGPEYLAQLAREALQRCDLAWIVVDLADVCGSLDGRLCQWLAGKPFICVGNKADLLPSRASFSEVRQWLQARLQACGLEPAETLLADSRHGRGLQQLLSASLGLVEQKRHPLIAVAGATNTGKSTLTRFFLGWQRPQGPPAGGPTVSRLAGTTQGNIFLDLPHLSTQLMDTPGIVPGGRLTDLLSPGCALPLVPSHPLHTRLYRLRPGQTLLLGGVAALDVAAVEGPDSVLLVFVSSEVRVHRTTSDRWRQVWERNCGLWLVPPYAACRQEVERLGWQEENVGLQPGQDLAIAGVGWVSVRRAALRLRLSIPQGVRTEVRPAQVGPRFHEGPGAGVPRSRNMGRLRRWR